MQLYSISIQKALGLIFTLIGIISIIYGLTINSTHIVSGSLIAFAFGKLFDIHASIEEIKKRIDD